MAAFNVQELAVSRGASMANRKGSFKAIPLNPADPHELEIRNLLPAEHTAPEHYERYRRTTPERQLALAEQRGHLNVI